MDPLAATAATPAVPAFPTQWITSGAVTPVIASPAATAATAWVPQPTVAAPQAHPGSGSLLDAIASALLGSREPAGPAATSAGDAQIARQQLAHDQLAMQAVAPPQVEVPAAHLQPTQAQGAAAAPAAPAASAERPDPTLQASVSGAIAGFASATGRSASAVADAAGAGVSRARRAGSELWAGVRSPRAIHISQVPSKYNSAPAAGNRDCGPASVAMTLRLLGKSIPGTAANAAPQRVINRVRQLAGNVSNAASTTNHELGRALRAAGTKTREIADAVSIRQAVLGGKPVILNGNPRNAGAYGRSFGPSQMTPYDGAHWIVVSGFDSKAGKFIINDPLSKIGPVKVTPAQLEAYRAGSMGIEVRG